jgi:hypothetical protein
MPFKDTALVCPLKQETAKATTTITNSSSIFMAGCKNSATLNSKLYKFLLIWTK